MHAYAIQPSAGLVKLDAMENPYRLPPSAAGRARASGSARVAINRYPASASSDLRRGAGRARRACPPAASMMLGNGSDELISLLALACDVPGATVLAPVPGFVMYAMCGAAAGAEVRRRAADADFELDEPAMLAAIADAPAGHHLPRLPEQPDRQPVRRRASIERIVEAVGAQAGWW